MPLTAWLTAELRLATSFSRCTSISVRSDMLRKPVLLCKPGLVGSNGCIVQQTLNMLSAACISIYVVYIGCRLFVCLYSSPNRRLDKADESFVRMLCKQCWHSAAEPFDTCLVASVCCRWLLTFRRNNGIKLRRGQLGCLTLFNKLLSEKVCSCLRMQQAFQHAGCAVAAYIFALAPKDIGGESMTARDVSKLCCLLNNICCSCLEALGQLDLTPCHTDACTGRELLRPRHASRGVTR